MAGYDLTFSAPKSVWVLWASAPDRPAQDQVRAAHHEGVKAAISLLEADGIVHPERPQRSAPGEGLGVMAAAFDHRTSRTGDPTLRTRSVRRLLGPGLNRSLPGRSMRRPLVGRPGT